MSKRVALPVLMWSISAAGAEEPPADPPVILQAAYFDTDAEDFIDLEVDTFARPTRPDNFRDAELGLVFTGQNSKVSVSYRF